MNTVHTQPGQPLNWNFDGKALHVYKVPGTINGTHYFNLNDWGNWSNPSHSGGSWEDWSVNNGVLSTAPGNGLSQSCALSVGENELTKFNALPNPFSNYISMENAENAQVEIFDSLGKKIFSAANFTSNTIETSQFSSGLYFVKIQKEGKTATKKMVKN